MNTTETTKIQREINDNLIDMNMILELLELPNYQDSAILHKRFEELHRNTEELRIKLKELMN